MMITMVLVVVLINSHLKVSIYNDSDNNDDDDYNDNTNNTNNTHHYYHYHHYTTLPPQYYNKFDLI